MMTAKGMNASRPEAFQVYVHTLTKTRGWMHAARLGRSTAFSGLVAQQPRPWGRLSVLLRHWTGKHLKEVKGMRRSFQAFPLLMFAACADSSVYEYFELRAEAEEYDCGCFTTDQSAIERCLENKEEQREYARACAVAYVEDSRKKLKRVEPIYACFVDTFRDRMDCVAEKMYACGLSTAYECPMSSETDCVVKHYSNDIQDAESVPDEAARGLAEISACARAAEMED